MPEDRTQDLTVKGESIEQIYRTYRDKRYLVNRRYQRKLVWSLEEKQSFIDSIARGYPVPIILLAEAKRFGASLFEIIDGMQRLNAIISFIENAYTVNTNDVAKYFDLETMASTKEQLDAGLLVQHEPKMSRAECVTIASYTMPLSVYEFSSDGQVEEIFRRINSGGRQLSRQELRMAGSLELFTSAVRITASRVRGDSSASDELLLNDMAKISISNRELEYGIPVDDVFWVKQGILTKDQLRESKDEELVADILAYVLTTPKPSSRSEFLDDYFGLRTGEASDKRRNDLNLEVQKRTVDIISADFQRVIDQLLAILSHDSTTFGSLLFNSPPQRAPRYFQVVFLALYALMVEQNKRIDSLDEVVRSLRNSGANIVIQEGGRWGADNRVHAVNSMVGIMQGSFVEAGTTDPANARWVLQFENLLSNSFTEQAAYDFKQGFLRLDGSHQLDTQAIEKILETLVGIANISPGTTGYVIVGVADNQAAAKRVRDLYGVTATIYRGYHVIGVAHEAGQLGRNLDQQFQWLADLISNSAISDPLKSYIRNHLKLIRYNDKAIFILQTKAQEQPSHVGGKYFDRSGNQLRDILPADFGGLFARFIQRG